MDKFIHQVPELKLRTRIDSIQLHRNDVANYPGHKEGDVVKFKWYSDDNGKQWFDADIKYYIQLQGIIDREKALVEESEMELV